MIQKLIYTTPIKAKLLIYPQVDSRLNPFTQYFLELTDGRKIKAYPTDKFVSWLKRNPLDPNTYYIFKGQFRTVRDFVYEHDSLVVNPLLGIELEEISDESKEQTEFVIPIRIFQVYKDQEKYSSCNFILGSVKNLNEINKSDRKAEFPIKLCFDKCLIETKYPDFQLVSKEGWATVIRKDYNLYMIDFQEV